MIDWSCVDWNRPTPNHSPPANTRFVCCGRSRSDNPLHDRGPVQVQLWPPDVRLRSIEDSLCQHRRDHDKELTMATSEEVIARALYILPSRSASLPWNFYHWEISAYFWAAAVLVVLRFCSCRSLARIHCDVFGKTLRRAAFANTHSSKTSCGKVLLSSGVGLCAGMVFPSTITFKWTRNSCSTIEFGVLVARGNRCEGNPCR